LKFKFKQIWHLSKILNLNKFYFLNKSEQKIEIWTKFKI
jgi:hypothetical protein